MAQNPPIQKAKELLALRKFEGYPDLTSKTLEQLRGNTIVPKQHIQAITKQPGVKQYEKELIDKILTNFKKDNKINISQFADKFHKELLPLTRTENPLSKWDSWVLPDEIGGKGENYQEHIYNSPYENEKGEKHFNSEVAPAYFAHTRTDEPDEGDNEKIRRILEMQSDLMQEGQLEGAYGVKNIGEAKSNARFWQNQADIAKANLEDYPKIATAFHLGLLNDVPWDIPSHVPYQLIQDAQNDWKERIKERLGIGDYAAAQLAEGIGKGKELVRERVNRIINPERLLEGQNIAVENQEKARQALRELRNVESGKSPYNRLKPYEDSWHNRIIHEEIKQAAKDGITKLRFPTGDTIAKIEKYVGGDDEGDGVPENIDEGEEFESPYGNNYTVIADHGSEVEAIPSENVRGIYNYDELRSEEEDGRREDIAYELEHSASDYKDRLPTTQYRYLKRYGFEKFENKYPSTIDDLVKFDVDGMHTNADEYANYYNDTLGDNSVHSLRGEQVLLAEPDEDGRYPEPQYYTKGGGKESPLYRDDLYDELESDEQKTVYNFYEHELPKALKHYNSEQMRDDNGITWNEVNIKPEYANAPIPAFSHAPLTPTQPIGSKQLSLPMRNYSPEVIANAQKKL